MSPSALRHVQVDRGGSARRRLGVLVHGASACGVFTEHVYESRACDTRTQEEEWGVDMSIFIQKRQQEEGEE